MHDAQLDELSTVMGDLSNAFQLQGRLADAFELGRQRLQLLRLRNAAPSLVGSDRQPICATCNHNCANF
jgi:hypothetical protein